jgi:pilus assembly protein CpaB
MRLRIALLIVALILGVIAVVGVVTYITSIRTAAEEEVEKIKVLVAAQNIPGEVSVDSIIEAQSVVLEEIPRKYLAEGVLTSLDSYKGYVVSVPINKGEQITTTKFIKPEDIGLAFVVPEDMVAISIPVNEIIGVSKLITEGDRVNVIATFQIPEENSESVQAAVSEEAAEQIEPSAQEEESASAIEVTKTVLWNVEILYIGTKIRTVQEDRTILGAEDATEREERTLEINTVTLALSPKDSEKLVFSEEFGSVWLALLPVDGLEEEETPGISYDNIFE